ncbi:MAG TPA: VanW family protein [Acidimicrobiales bacterium]
MTTAEDTNDDDPVTTNQPTAPESPTPASAGEASGAGDAAASSSPAAAPSGDTWTPPTPTPASEDAASGAAPSGDTWTPAAPTPTESTPSSDTWAPPPSPAAAPSGDTWTPPTPTPASEDAASGAAPSGDTWTPPTPTPAGEGGSDRANGQDAIVESAATPAGAAPSGDTWAPPSPTPAGEGGAGADRPGADDPGAGDDDSPTVVLGGVGAASQPTSPAPRLSPDAVAATTSTRTTDPHGLRAVRPRITPPTGTTRIGDGEGEAMPRHLRTDEEGGERRRTLLLVAAPILIVVLFLLGWAIDSAALSGQVMRNVEVAGRPVGGLGEASLPEVMAEIAAEEAERPVEIVNGDRTYETTAGAVGLTVDEEATAEAALDAGRNDSILVRPFRWLGSFFGSRQVPVEYTVSEGAAALTLAQLQGGDATAPVEPQVVLDEASGEFTIRPGQTGTGINVRDVVAELPEAAAESESGTIVIEAESAVVEPQYTDEAAQELADRANEMTADGLTLRVDQTTVQVPPDQLRRWVGQAPPDQGFELAINGDAVRQELPQLFSDLAEPQDATVTLVNGRPQVQPGRNGLTCCNDDSAQRIWNALQEDEAEVTLEAQVTEPETTTEEAEAWRIAEPVGGARAWRDGSEVPGPAPGFTTYYQPGQSRVTNIHRIAELVRGAVIPPDGTFSINEHVGPRTTENGFVPAGAIRNGQHVDEVGGGVSQFATTMFNAAYFAGLDIVEYQAHSEWFSRYPRGREATMGYPNPDLRIHNNTPYGVLIWTSVTDTSVTVTLYSTPYITAEQTGSEESPAGPGCTTVVTTRTRRWIEDGRTETDTFRATYRNVSDIDCQGNPIPPPDEEEGAPPPGQ